MTGTSDFHLFGPCARRPVAARHRGHHPLRAATPSRANAKPTLLRKALVLLARLRRFLNGQVAAVIAHHEQQAAVWTQHALDHRSLDRTRLYRGPIDQICAKATRLGRAA